MTASTKLTGSSLYEFIIIEYIEFLKTSPNYVNFKDYCSIAGYLSSYKQTIDWSSHTRGVSIHEIKVKYFNGGLSAIGKHSSIIESPQDESSFIQFYPSSKKTSVLQTMGTTSILKGVGLVFPNGVSLTLQECTSENLMSLLTSYDFINNTGGI